MPRRALLLLCYDTQYQEYEPYYKISFKCTVLSGVK